MAKKLSNSFYRAVADVPMHRDLASQPYSPLISLMTADYLLTAKDLPGWPGDVSAIDYKNLLMKGLKELAQWIVCGRPDKPGTHDSRQDRPISRAGSFLPDEGEGNEAISVAKPFCRECHYASPRSAGLRHV